jgi:photosystem II stability/assembly factor-like uncharacterized protein
MIGFLRWSAVFLAVSTIVFLGSCKSTTEPPEDVLEYVGWAAGADVASDGYAAIFHTTDGGATWTRQAETLTQDALVYIRAVDSLTAWVVGAQEGGYGQIYRTVDGGETWNRKGDLGQIPNEGLFDVDALDASTAWVVGGDNTILFTQDGGTTWVSKADPAYDNSGTMTGVAAVTEDDVWVCNGGDNGFVIHTTDGGNSWTLECDTSLFGADVDLISLCAVNANCAFVVGHAQTVIGTFDGGDHWELLTPDTLQHGFLDANGVCAISDSILWVVLDAGTAWHSDDAGQNWENQPTVPGANGYYMMRICAMDENIAWITGTNAYGGDDGILLFTTDGGATWNEQEYVMPGLEVGLHDISFVGSWH